jgi:hypothetical protein
MKKLIYIIYFGFLIITSIECKSQSLVLTGKAWTYAEGENIPEFKLYRYSVLKIVGDTMISDVLYKQLTEQPDKNYLDIRLKGFIRETDERKVYYREAKGDKEHLLYDFSLAANDSVYSDYFGTWMVLDSIKTDKKNKQNYYLHYWKNQPLHWIEGIGSTSGLLMENTVEGFSEFTCCTLNGEIIYNTEYADGCDLITSVKNIKQTQLLHMFTLGENSLLIIPGRETKGELIFYNLRGEKVAIYRVASMETTICLPETGIMLYRYKTSTEAIQTGKVLVK